MNQNTKSDNCFNSAVQQISMIRDRDISCKELLDLHIDNLKSNIVVIFADGGWKYLSTGIYAENYKFKQSEIEGKTWW